MAHTCWAKNIQSRRMEQPELVLGAASSHVEALSRRITGKHSDTGFTWGSNHTKKHDVSFIALERIGVTTDQSSLFNYLWLKSLKKLVLN